MIVRLVRLALIMLALFLQETMSFVLKSPVKSGNLRESQVNALEVRRSFLIPWQTNRSDPVILGWSEERRLLPLRNETFWVNHDHYSHEVSVGWNADDSAVTTVALPTLASTESVGSTLWPAGLAAAMLARAPALRQFWQSSNDCRVLEVGAGLGLLGWTVAADAASVVLTDHDYDVVQGLQELAACEYNPGCPVAAHVLDWREEAADLNSGRPVEQFDAIVGSDVAYYFHLVRPLVDTVQRYLRPDQSLAFLVGQANRESLWSLYHQVRDGGYSQQSDRQEPPLQGNTRMLLYKLLMEPWREEDNSGSSSRLLTERSTPLKVDWDQLDGEVPIAALIHRSPGCPLPDAFTDLDWVATKQDEEQMEMSF
jgi:predicted nicotinamide N-methyase